MSTIAPVSLEEYLTTTYRPDCDYLEGALVERNLGQKNHSKLQGEVLLWFGIRRKALNMRAFPEQRVRVAPRRYRIPDVCVVTLPEPDEQIFTHPPYICIEVLSPEDTLARIHERCLDYLAMGVLNVWILDPEHQRGWSVSRAGCKEPLDGVLRTSDGRVALPIAELFQLDN